MTSDCVEIEMFALGMSEQALIFIRIPSLSGRRWALATFGALGQFICCYLEGNQKLFLQRQW
jgi:hypothetical protein